MVLLAIVEGIPETDYNVRKIVVSLLKLNNVVAIYTNDMKMANLLLGLSVRDQNSNGEREGKREI